MGVTQPVERDAGQLKTGPLEPPAVRDPGRRQRATVRAGEHQRPPPFTAWLTVEDGSGVVIEEQGA